eukprot:gene3020-5919_t
MDLYGDLPPAAEDGKESTIAGGWARPNASLVPKRHAQQADTKIHSVVNPNTNTLNDKNNHTNDKDKVSPVLKSKTSTPVARSTGPAFSFKPRQAPIVPSTNSSSTFETSKHSTSVEKPQTKPVESASPVGVSMVATFDVVDPYDPAKPNDYLSWCEERLERKRRARMEIENRKTIEESDRKRAVLEKERHEAAQKGDIEKLKELQGGSSMSAGAGRGRGRGLSNLPAWMTNTPEPRGESPSATDGSHRSQQQFEDSEDDIKMSSADNRNRRMSGDGFQDDHIGSRLLGKMGYQEGSGLGKSGQGITKPIEHRKVGNSQGVIVMDAVDRDRQASGGQQDNITPHSHSTSTGTTGKRKMGMFSNPSCVLLLKNMVAPGDAVSSLAQETKEECQKYGPVKRCEVFDVSESSTGSGLDNTCPPEEIIRTFVAFETQESAVRAYRDLNGRFFGGRQISASFYDEGKFNRNDLAPVNGEW